MKTVKILSLTLLMSIFCGGMIFAQQQEQRGQKAKASPEERASRRVEMMKKTLDLTPEQAAKLQSLQTQFFKDQEQARATAKGNHQDMKTKMEAYDGQVKSILTPEQYQKYQDQRASMMKKGNAQQGKVNKDGNQKSKENRKGKMNKEKKVQTNKQ